MSAVQVDICGGAFVCLGCHDWQIDVTHHARSDMGGARNAQWAAMEVAALEHLPECVGNGGRVRVGDQWVDRPNMQEGEQADGVLGLIPFPKWWVTK